MLFNYEDNLRREYHDPEHNEVDPHCAGQLLSFMLDVGADERPWQLNMFTLIAIGVGTAYLFSAAVMLMPGAFPNSFAPGDKVGVYFEAAAVIVQVAYDLLDWRSTVELGFDEIQERRPVGLTIPLQPRLAPSRTTLCFRTMFWQRLNQHTVPRVQRGQKSAIPAPNQIPYRLCLMIPS